MTEYTPDQLFSGPSRYPIHLQPKSPTMDKKLILNVAPCGAFIRRDQNPTMPYSPQEVAKEVIESYREGAAMWHVHIRTPEGYPNKKPEDVKRAMDLVFAECPDIVTSVNVIAAYGKEGLALMRPLVDPLREAGLRYIQTVVIHTTTSLIGPFVDRMDRKQLEEVVRYMEEAGIRVEFQCYHPEGLENVRNWIIKPGIQKTRPYLININLGKKSDPAQFEEPWNYIYLMTRLQRVPAESAVTIVAGGRNWLPLTVMGVLLGADSVRIGKEDAVFQYPHRDEVIQSNAAVVRQVRTLAEALGREIASPADARKILGLSDPRPRASTPEGRKAK